MSHPKNFLPTADAAGIRKALTELLRAHRRAIALLLVLHALAVAFTIMSPLLFGRLLDRIEDFAPGDGMLSLIAAICAALVARAIFTWLAQRASFRFGESVFLDLRNDVIAGVISLPQRSLDEAPAGDVLARTSNDIDAVSEGVRVGLPEVLVATVTVVITVTSSFLLDWRVALASVVGLPLLFVATRWYVRRSQPAYAAELEAHAEFETSVLATVRGARTIDAYNLGLASKARMRAGAGRVSAAEAHTLTLQTKWFPMVQAAYYLPVALVVLWGGWLVLEGQTTIGTVVTIALCVQLVVDPLDDLLYWTDQLQLASVAFARIVGVSRDASLRADRRKLEAPTAQIGAHLVVDNVTFGYGPNRPLFSGLSVEFEAGSRTMIVGASGAGKSTLALLLAGLYAPDSGSIGVAYDSGRARREAGTDDVMLVTQEGYLFDGTLEYNLRLAHPGATRAELENSLLEIGGEAFLREFEDGLATHLDDIHASAITRQRIALARVLLRNPTAVILDEATASLSVADAARLEESLHTALKGRTVVTIAHRLSSATTADRILVVDSGLIIEDGSHEDLLERGGAYSRLWRTWSPRGRPSSSTGANR